MNNSFYKGHVAKEEVSVIKRDGGIDGGHSVWKMSSKVTMLGTKGDDS